MSADLLENLSLLLSLSCQIVRMLDMDVKVMFSSNASGFLNLIYLYLINKVRICITIDLFFFHINSMVLYKN